MTIKTKSVAEWVKASYEKPSETKEYSVITFGGNLTTAYYSVKHDVWMWSARGEAVDQYWQIKWLKPITERYCLTEDELVEVLAKFAARSTDYTLSDVHDKAKQFLQSITNK